MISELMPQKKPATQADASSMLKKLKTLLDSTTDSICMLDTKLRYLHANKQHLKRIQKNLSQVIGSDYKQYHTQNNFPIVLKNTKKVIETKKSLQYEYQSSRDGSYFLRTISPVIDANTKKVTAITITSKDINSQKKVEQRLAEELKDAEKLNQLMVGRELKMVELKKG